MGSVATEQPEPMIAMKLRQGSLTLAKNADKEMARSH